ncbi:hypothetical protein LIA77_07251 [Sarocladium implicatum]|nr:hypothetical protein LIA77_07251 [Sarocladium implicatum]
MNGSFEVHPERIVKLRDEDDSPQACTAKAFLVLGPGLSSEVIAVVVVYDVSFVDHKTSSIPGELVGSKAMEDAKNDMIEIVGKMEAAFPNFDHCELLVIMGADCQRAIWRPSITEPVIADIKDRLPVTTVNNLNAAASHAANVPVSMAIYMPLALEGLLAQLLDEFVPKATLWDEGGLDFSVEGVVYPYPSRVIIVRDEAVRDKDVEATDQHDRIQRGVSRFRCADVPLEAQ